MCPPVIYFLVKNRKFQTFTKLYILAKRGMANVLMDAIVNLIQC